MDKREKFKALAERRTNMAIDAILRIGKLSNRQLYVYDDADIKKIAKALRDTVGEIEERFASPKARASKRFHL